MRKLTLSLAALAAACSLASPVWAAISPADATAISSAVSNAIAGASANGPAAIVDAIKTAAEAEMKLFGPGQDVAAQIIADALAAGASPQEIGQALAAAALELGAPMSTDIADAIGAYGDAETLGAFDASVAGGAGGAQLADEANGHKRPPGRPIDADVNVGGDVSGAGTGPSGSGCINPSCT